MGRNQRHRRLLELSTSLQRLVTSIGLHASCWRGSACTAKAAVAHIWPPRSSDIWPASYTLIFCSSNKFLSSQKIPGAQMTNTSEWPRVSSKGLLLSSCAAKLSPAIPATESRSETCSHREAYHSWMWTSKHIRWDGAHWIHCTFSPFLLHPGLEKGKKKKERRPRCSSQLWPPLPKSSFKLCCFGNNSFKTPSLLHFRST